MDEIFLRRTIERPHFNTIIIQNPPEKLKKEYFNWPSSLAQCLTSALSFSIISFIITNQINITLLAALISATGSFFADIFSFCLNNSHRNKEVKEENDVYIRYINRRIAEIEQNKRILKNYYEDNYPDHSVCKSRLERKVQWDRNISNDDFLYLTIGNVIDRVQDLKLPVLSPEQEEIYAPVFEKLQKTVEIEHTIGVSIKNKTVVCISNNTIDDILKGIMIDLCYHHSYTDIQLVMVLSQDRFSADNTLYNGYDESLIARTEEERETIISDLLSILIRRNDSKIVDNHNKEIIGPIFPCYILIAEEDLLSNQNILQLVSFSHKEIGFSLLLLSMNSSRYISLADVIIEDREDSVLIHDNKRNPIACKSFSLDVDWKQLVSLMNKTDGVTDFSFTRSVLFSAGIGKKITKEFVKNNWDEHASDELIDVPIAMDDKGEIFSLSLSEYRFGPHLLITGMTGSGKTEFLITLIISLTIRYPADRITYYIMDFKGGYLVDLFKEMPQFVMGISDLQDINEVELFCSSIEIEMRRRESLFQLAGCRDINDYNRFGEQKISDVFIIIDEFAELKREQPQIMNQIVRIGLVGRSLGFHLVLSTQYAAGVVDDILWKSMSSRLCFRSTELDSYDILGLKIASDIVNAGRCFLSHNNNLHELQILYSEKEVNHILQEVKVLTEYSELKKPK